MPCQSFLGGFMLQLSSMRNFSWGVLQDFGSRVVRGILENNLFSRVCVVGRRILESRVSNALGNHKVTLLAAGAAGGLGFVWGRSFVGAATRNERSALIKTSQYPQPAESDLIQRSVELQRAERALQQSIETWLPLIEGLERRLIDSIPTGDASGAAECNLIPRSQGTSQNPSPGREADPPNLDEFLERLNCIVEMSVNGFPKPSGERGFAFERQPEMARKADEMLRKHFQSLIETYLPYLKRMESQTSVIQLSIGSLPEQETVGTSRDPSPGRDGDAPTIEGFLERLGRLVQSFEESSPEPSDSAHEDDKTAQLDNYCEFFINAYFTALKRIESKMNILQPSSLTPQKQKPDARIRILQDRLDALFYSVGKMILGENFGIGLSREPSPQTG